MDKPNTDNGFNISFYIGWSPVSNKEWNIESVVSVWFIHVSTYPYHLVWFTKIYHFWSIGCLGFMVYQPLYVI